MNRFYFCIAFLASTLLPSGPAAADFPPQAVLAPVKTVLSAISRMQPGALAKSYSDDAVVIDNQQPIRWTGASAGSEWLSDVTGQWGKLRLARFKAKLIPSDILVGNDDAYVVVPGVLVGVVPSHPFRESGAYLFTLRKTGSQWKITNQSWTALPPA